MYTLNYGLLLATTVIQTHALYNIIASISSYMCENSEISTRYEPVKGNSIEKSEMANALCELGINSIL